MFLQIPALNVQPYLCRQQGGESAEWRLFSLQPGSSDTGQSHTEYTDTTHTCFTLCSNEMSTYRFFVYSIPKFVTEAEL